jgi:hypothetical protein
MQVNKHPPTLSVANFQFQFLKLLDGPNKLSSVQHTLSLTFSRLHISSLGQNQTDTKLP